ncbi:putative cyclin-dependent protein kinase inhibitor SMR [Helianthus annuus]|nr:putative cyclin-dependent protein kinase inhibitor SMR [Helianthus annuus]KAJ0887438.1 putative cyclin-dependent protein kinase inhibitor SMR [Helianthus annuus]
MSTDLQLRPDPPVITSSLKIKVPRSSTQPDQSCSLQLLKPEIEIEIHTPKSPEHKIPEAVTCPPAPKKPRISCKRRISEFEFFEIDEIESFFKSSYQNSSMNQRSCIPL